MKKTNMINLDALNLAKDDRPFVCDGNPLNCEIFIVGFNPATRIETDFREFYQNGIFNKKEFDLAYQKARKASSPQKNDSEKYSRTRTAMKVILSSFPTSQILQTNVYFKPTARAKELEKIDRKPEQFVSLLKSFNQSGNPKVIYVHGSKSIKHFVRALKLQGDFSIKNGEVKSCFVEYENQKFTLVWTYHLSFQSMVTDQMLQKVVAEIKQALNK